MAKNRLKPTLAQSWRIVHDKEAKGSDVDFSAELARSRRAEENGAWEEACEVRFAAVQQLVDLLPEDEAVELDWEDAPTRDAIVLLYASATDFFLVGDMEMAAAQLEMILDVDSEDHLEASTLLAFVYVAMGEWESLDDILPDLDEKGPERQIVLLWSHFLRHGTIDEKALGALRRFHGAYLKEWTATEHPADEAYRADLGSERPSRDTLARGLWLQTEHFWAGQQKFLIALRAKA